MNTDPGVSDEAFCRWKSVRTEFSHALNDYLVASVEFCKTLSSSTPSLPSLHNSLEQTLSDLDLELRSLQADEERLKETRMALARERNRSRALAPIHRLPSEILVAIFVMSNGQYTRNDRPMTFKSRNVSPSILSAVCSSWRHIALETPSLWAYIRVVASEPWDSSRHEKATAWAQRSRNHPLYIDLWDYELSTSCLFISVREAEITNLIKFLTPLMPRVHVLDITLQAVSHKMLSSIMECWIKSGSTISGKILQLSNVYHQEGSTFILAPASCGAVSSKVFNEFVQTFSRLCFVNCRVSPIVLSTTLVELHLEQLNGPHSPTQKQLAAMLAASPELRILSLVNCRIEPSKKALISVVLNHLQCLSLESFDDSRCFKHVFPLLSVRSDALNMSLTLDNSPDFIMAAKSFFNRTRVTRLRIQGYKNESLGLLFFPMPYIQTLAVECCVISGPQFQTPLNVNRGVRSQTPWPNLRILYLRRTQVDMNSLRNLALLHPLSTLHLYEPMSVGSEELMTNEEHRQLEESMPATEDFKIYNAGDDCVLDNWDFVYLGN